MKKIAIFAALFLTSSLALANGECVSDPKDVYSAGVKMPSGPYRGQCINTSGKRAIRILRDSTEGLKIANFRHKGKFWNAWIPKNSVEAVEFVFVDLNVQQVSRLGVNIFHNHLRLLFKKNHPITLTSQFSPRGEVKATVRDVILSVNYMAPTGVEYSAIKGLNSKEYLSAIQLYSTADEAKARFVEQKVNAFTTRLSINERQAWYLLRTALLKSHNTQYSVPYQTWDANCATAAFDMLDYALYYDYGKRVKPFRFKIWNIRDTSVKPALNALIERGLIKDNRSIYLVNTQFGYPRYPSRWSEF